MSHHHLTHKSPKIALLIEDCHGGKWDAHYLGYFRCFNGGDYYEAHDVLEELWLAEGKEGQGYDFYKGLIQIAGAFVHMKQHYYAPEHRAHGKRLAPAFRLLNRACDLTRPLSAGIPGFGPPRCPWNGRGLCPPTRIRRIPNKSLASGTDAEDRSADLIIFCGGPGPTGPVAPIPEPCL
jgi:hypothetical protein